jgi:hypothetical protein
MTTQSYLRFLFIMLLCVALLSSCGGNPHLRLVCVVDLSSSIETDARAEAFSAFQKIFAEHRLRRGDTVEIIPVTNDTATEAQGRVLRFEISERRAAYDADLKNLAAEVEREIGAMQSQSASRPATRSDIIGAINLAEEEIVKGQKGERKIIVVLSDMINDTPSCNFNTSPQLASDEAARHYAASLAEGRPRSLEGTRVYLGLLRSSDLKKVPQSRRSAIQSFWTEYLQRAGAASVSITTDGPSQLAEAVQEAQQSRP